MALVETKRQINGEYSVLFSGRSKETEYGRMTEKQANEIVRKVKRSYIECKKKSVVMKSVTVQIGDDDEFELGCCLPPEDYVDRAISVFDMVAMAAHIQDSYENESMELV